MKKSACILLACLVALGCERSDPPETLVTEYDQQEMDAAIARARGEVDSFIAELQKSDGENFFVKVPIEDNGKGEHFWLNNVTYRDGKFEGTVNNEPGIVTNITIGQKLRVNKSEISDWMYLRDGKMYGNYTLRPLMKSMPEDEAAQIRSILVAP